MEAFSCPSPCLSPSKIRCWSPHHYMRPRGKDDTDMNVLFICKKDERVATQMLQLVAAVHSRPIDYLGIYGCECFVEPWVLEHDLVPSTLRQVVKRFDTEDGQATLEMKDRMDLLVSLGGDGTVLQSAWYFQAMAVPPILPIYLHGTLGFLTGFDYDLAQETLMETSKTLILAEPSQLKVMLRMRLRCCVYKRRPIKNPSSAAPSSSPSPLPLPLPVQASVQPVLSDTFHVLNELVIDRGPNATMVHLELFSEASFMTSVMADGIVVATPTGSTAYSMSAGGAIVHPQVPCILVTPICPHTLSFRPFVYPEALQLKIRISEKSRGSAWASFDGRHRLELLPGDYVTVTVSRFPVPTLCLADSTVDWLAALSNCLNWNNDKRHASRPPLSSQINPASSSFLQQ